MSKIGTGSTKWDKEYRAQHEGHKLLDEDFRELMAAANTGNVNDTRMLLANKINPDAGGSRVEQTPLWRACFWGHSHVVQLLIEARASINRVSLTNGVPPIAIASQNGREFTVDCLVKAKADLELESGDYDTPPLILAAMNKHEGCVKRLLAGGAAVDHADSSGHTALWEAAQSGSDEIVKLLIENKANPNAFPIDTRATALYVACTFGQVKVAKRLLESGASPNITTQPSKGLWIGAKNGWIGVNFSPLHAAVLRRDEALIKLLLRHGTELDIHSKTTALDLAEYHMLKAHIKINRDLFKTKKKKDVRAEGVCRAVDSFRIATDRVKGYSVAGMSPTGRSCGDSLYSDRLSAGSPSFDIDNNPEEEYAKSLSDSASSTLSPTWGSSIGLSSPGRSKSPLKPWSSLRRSPGSRRNLTPRRNDSGISSASSPTASKSMANFSRRLDDRDGRMHSTLSMHVGGLSARLASKRSPSPSPQSPTFSTPTGSSTPNGIPEPLGSSIGGFLNNPWEINDTTSDGEYSTDSEDEETCLIQSLQRVLIVLGSMIPSKALKSTSHVLPPYLGSYWNPAHFRVKTCHLGAHAHSLSCTVELVVYHFELDTHFRMLMIFDPDYWEVEVQRLLQVSHPFLTPLCNASYIAHPEPLVRRLNEDYGFELPAVHNLDAKVDIDMSFAMAENFSLSLSSISAADDITMPVTRCPLGLVFPCDGQNLQRILSNDKKLVPRQAAFYTLQILQAIMHLHKNGFSVGPITVDRVMIHNDHAYFVPSGHDTIYLESPLLDNDTFGASLDISTVYSSFTEVDIGIDDVDEEAIEFLSRMDLEYTAVGQFLSQLLGLEWDQQAENVPQLLQDIVSIMKEDDTINVLPTVEARLQCYLFGPGPEQKVDCYEQWLIGRQSYIAEGRGHGRSKVWNAMQAEFLLGLQGGEQLEILHSSISKK